MKKLLNRTVLTYLISTCILAIGIYSSYHLYITKALEGSDGPVVEVHSTFIKTAYTVPIDIAPWESITDPKDKCFWSYPGILFKTNFDGSVVYYSDTEPQPSEDRLNSGDRSKYEFLDEFNANSDVTLKVNNKSTGAIRYNDLSDKVFYIHVKFTKNDGVKTFIRTYPIFTSRLYNNENLIGSWPFENLDPILRSNDEQTITFMPDISKTDPNYPSYNTGFEIYSTADTKGLLTEDLPVGGIWNKYKAAFKNKAESSKSNKIQVLNVYPDEPKSAQLQGWMSADGSFQKFGIDANGTIGKLANNTTGYGRGLIEVKTEPISSFTGDNLSQYDVIAFGSWDANANKDISDSARVNVEKWMENTNHNIILGHDTCINQDFDGGYKHTNLTALAVKYLGMLPNTTTIDQVRDMFESGKILSGSTVADYSPWFNGHLSNLDDSNILVHAKDKMFGLDQACYYNSFYIDDPGYAVGNSGSHVAQTTAAEINLNPFLKYPWNINMGNNNVEGVINFLDVPICHTTGQGWKFNSESTSYLAFYNNDYTRVIRDPNNSHVAWKNVKDKKNLAYLTVNNNRSAALIQTGHSSGMAIEQEKQIWANLIFALCSKNESSKDINAPLVDANGPVISSGVYNTETKSIDLKAADCETKNYFTINTTDTSGYNFALSKLIDYGWASGVKGYKYFFYDYPISETDIHDLETFNTISSNEGAIIHDSEIPLDKVKAGTFEVNSSIDISMTLDKAKYCYIIPYDYSKRTDTNNPNAITLDASNSNYGNVIRVEVNDAANLIVNTSIAGGDFTSYDDTNKIVWGKSGSNRPVIISGSTKAKTGEVDKLGLSLADSSTPPEADEDGIPNYNTTEFARYFDVDGSHFGYMKNPSSWIDHLDLSEEPAVDRDYLYKSINVLTKSSPTKEGVVMNSYAVEIGRAHV